MKELLKELEEMLMESSNYTKENRNSALYKIREELSRTVEPVAWMYDRVGYRVMPDGSMDDEIIKDLTTTDFAAAHSKIEHCHNIRPLFIHPTAKPVLLSDDELETIAVSDEFLLFCDQDEFNQISKAVEQAVLKANGLRGVE